MVPEKIFGYMMRHYDIDGLVQYGNIRSFAALQLNPQETRRKWGGDGQATGCVCLPDTYSRRLIPAQRLPTLGLFFANAALRNRYGRASRRDQSVG